MRKLILCLVCLGMLAASLPCAAEEVSQVVFLPRGAWVEAAEGPLFELAELSQLPDALQRIAQELGLPLADGALPSGTRLSGEQIEALYPGAEAYFAIPAQTPPPAPPRANAASAKTPTLTPFELNGEWFYAADGLLYFKDANTGDVMSVEAVFQALRGQGERQKIFYLTIDDAPSLYTMEMLAMLDELNIKATFFIVGAYARRNPIFLKAIYEQGHAIANHSYTHDAGTLNKSVQSCLTDFKRCEEAIHDALGFALPVPLIRIPYGSGSITREGREALQRAGYLWIDWNALNGDTESGITTDEAALERAFSTASRYDGDIVMLVHDGKKRTIRTLPEMVRKFQEMGYEFRVLTPSVEKIPGVRMGFPVK